MSTWAPVLYPGQSRDDVATGINTGENTYMYQLSRYPCCFHGMGKMRGGSLAGIPYELPRSTDVPTQLTLNRVSKQASDLKSPDAVQDDPVRRNNSTDGAACFLRLAGPQVV